MSFLRHLAAFGFSEARRFQLKRIYKKYAEYTMIPPDTYVRNLRLARTVQGVDGCVVECGVWRGGMISGIADVLGPGREYFLFDSFEGLPPAKSIDGASALAWQADKDSPNYLDNCTAAADFANAAMRKSSATRFSLVKGWFDDTLPSFRAPGGIALLRLDGDWYDSTMTCLKFLLPQVVAGGIVIVDDYHTWDGCTRAVHEQLAGTSSCWRIGQYEGDVCTLVRSPELHSGRTSSEDDCASQSATSGGREQPE